MPTLFLFFLQSLSLPSGRRNPDTNSLSPPSSESTRILMGMT